MKHDWRITCPLKFAFRIDLGEHGTQLTPRRYANRNLDAFEIPTVMGTYCTSQTSLALDLYIYNTYCMFTFSGGCAYRFSYMTSLRITFCFMPRMREHSVQPGLCASWSRLSYRVCNNCTPNTSNSGLVVGQNWVLNTDVTVHCAYYLDRSNNQPNCLLGESGIRMLSIPARTLNRKVPTEKVNVELIRPPASMEHSITDDPDDDNPVRLNASPCVVRLSSPSVSPFLSISRIPFVRA